ncbi:unnamed protein product [Effrenium voratum]|uniref:Uncharacterized protein n=1 Tax=Effrenium voratum TaxID=2562239 RepID=A0AA36NHG2_9DINO|nr:unnamed protein product [Effrenium voratum]CAJ1449292.1 unnamed protein product [Effrenium voratum]
MSSSSDSSSSSSEEEKKKKKKDKKKDKKKSKKKEKKKGKKKDKKKKEKKEKDPYSKNAQEKARLEAQQRLMGIDTNKKPKKKTRKKKSSSSESSEEKLRKLQDRIEDQTLQREAAMAEEAEKNAEPIPEKSWEEMTWPERAALAGQKAEAEAIWLGATKAQARGAGGKASEQILMLAAEDGVVVDGAMKPRARFNAATGAVSRG